MTERRKSWMIGCIVILSSILSSSLTAQGERSTQQQVDAQTKYMDALIDTYMNKYDIAIPKFLELYREDRKNGVVALELAKAYHITENYEDADKYASIAVRELPEDVWVQLFYADLMIDLEKYSEAGNAFKKLTIIDSDDLSHIDNYIKSLVSNGQLKEAEKEVETWHKTHEIREELLEVLYQEYAEQKNEKKAEKTLKLLAEAYPSNSRYLNNLAQFYLQRGKKKNAKEWYDKAIAIDANDPRANAALATLNSEGGDDASFLRSMLPVIEDTSIDPSAKVRELIPFLDKYYTTQDSVLGSSILEITSRLCLVHPGEVKCLAIHADALSLAGKNQEAIETYKKSLTIDNTTFSVWSQLMVLLLDEKSYTELSTTAYDALDYFPNKMEGYYYYAIAQNKLENHQEAIEILKEAYFISGKNNNWKSKVKTEEAYSFLGLKKYPESQKSIEEAIALSEGKNPLAWSLQGDIYDTQGFQEKADEARKKAEELISKDFKPKQ